MHLWQLSYHLVLFSFDGIIEINLFACFMALAPVFEYEHHAHLLCQQLQMLRALNLYMFYNQHHVHLYSHVPKSSTMRCLVQAPFLQLVQCYDRGGRGVMIVTTTTIKRKLRWYCVHLAHNLMTLALLYFV